MILVNLIFSAGCIIQLSYGAFMRRLMDTRGALGYLEAAGPVRRVAILRYGGAVYDPSSPALWPLYAEPSLYVRQGASEIVRHLADFLQSRPERRRFGIYAAPRDRVGNHAH
jgi:hypothetical protein